MEVDVSRCSLGFNTISIVEQLVHLYVPKSVVSELAVYAVTFVFMKKSKVRKVCQYKII